MSERPQNDRREFIRKSLGAAPLVLTLGSRSHGNGTSMHGTLWSSMGTKWKHKGDWWRFKKDGWRWSKKGGHRYHDKNDHRNRNDDHQHKVTKPKGWDWSREHDQWQRGVETERHSERKDYDWRRDDEGKLTHGEPSYKFDKPSDDKD